MRLSPSSRMHPLGDGVPAEERDGVDGEGDTAGGLVDEGKGRIVEEEGGTGERDQDKDD